MSKSKRKYKTGGSLYNPNIPFIRMSGKWLQERGFDVGTIFEVIEGKNMIILAKKTDYQVKEDSNKYEVSKLEKKLQQLRK